MPGSSPPIAPRVIDRLRADGELMAHYALQRGYAVEGEVLSALQDGNDGNLQTLARAHAALAQLIAPATPRSITALEHNAAATLMAQLFGVACVCLVGCIATALSPRVSVESLQAGPLHSNGIVLLLNMVFLLAIAGLGGCLGALGRLRRAASKDAYDPTDRLGYWAHVGSGLVSGLVLSQLVDLSSTATAETASLTAAAHSRPGLALLGGYASSVLLHFLDRIVGAVGGVIRGDPDDESSAPKAPPASSFAAAPPLPPQGTAPAPQVPPKKVPAPPTADAHPALTGLGGTSGPGGGT